MTLRGKHAVLFINLLGKALTQKKLVDKEAPNHGFLICVIKFSCETNFTREGTCQS